MESKVLTARAYDVAESSVGCQLRCRPRHLTEVLNYEALLAVLKLHLRLEICSRKCSNQTKPNQTDTRKRAGWAAEWLES